VIDTADLNIHHPYLHMRRFTLAPLAEIAPDFVHPILGITIAEILDTCPDELEVRKTEYKL
jgi:2-amino-4-hydroxy-6-hydroxymethyldihydropteridine diphosphokinase